MAGRLQHKKANFWLHPPPISLDIYSTLYFYLCISVVTVKSKSIIRFRAFLFLISRNLVVKTFPPNNVQDKIRTYDFLTISRPR